MRVDLLLGRRSSVCVWEQQRNGPSSPSSSLLWAYSLLYSPADKAVPQRQLGEPLTCSREDRAEPGAEGEE